MSRVVLIVGVLLAFAVAALAASQRPSTQAAYALFQKRSASFRADCSSATCAATRDRMRDGGSIIFYAIAVTEDEGYVVDEGAKEDADGGAATGDGAESAETTTSGRSLLGVPGLVGRALLSLFAPLSERDDSEAGSSTIASSGRRTLGAAAGAAPAGVSFRFAPVTRPPPPPPPRPSPQSWGEGWFPESLRIASLGEQGASLSDDVIADWNTILRDETDDLEPHGEERIELFAAGGAGGDRGAASTSDGMNGAGATGEASSGGSGGGSSSSPWSVLGASTTVTTSSATTSTAAAAATNAAATLFAASLRREEEMYADTISYLRDSLEVAISEDSLAWIDGNVESLAKVARQMVVERTAFGDSAAVNALLVRLGHLAERWEGDAGEEEEDERSVLAPEDEDADGGVAAAEDAGVERTSLRRRLAAAQAQPRISPTGERREHPPLPTVLPSADEHPPLPTVLPSADERPPLLTVLPSSRIEIDDKPVRLPPLSLDSVIVSTPVDRDLAPREERFVSTIARHLNPGVESKGRGSTETAAKNVERAVERLKAFKKALPISAFVDQAVSTS